MKKIISPFQGNQMQDHYHSQLLFENNNKQLVYQSVHLYHLVNTIDLIQPVQIKILMY